MYQAHRPNRLREALEILAFFVGLFAVVTAMSVTP